MRMSTKRPFVRSLILALLALVLLSGAVLALAPPPGLQLDWWVMSGGEAARSGGSLQIDATIGQPAIGLSSSGPLALSWGYWFGQAGDLPRGYLPLIMRN